MTSSPTTPRNVEWELDTNMNRTGRYRRRQYYAKAGLVVDRRTPAERVKCEWREGRR